MSRSISYTDAINEALHLAMHLDPSVICYGLGVPDPGYIFGTTKGLQERFGEKRVFDMPTSENAMTGIAIGAAISGIRPIMVHQRLDFFLLAMDQLVNNAAKWHYMFGGRMNVPLTIRLIIGRGWGQGPTHSQSLQAWFAHIPGLKVVMPTTPADAKGLLLESIFDENPVVFLEHRWLHASEGHVPEGDTRISLGSCAIPKKGTDCTVVGMSYMTAEALRAASYLETKKISCEVIDLRTINPIDFTTIFKSVRKTGRLVVLDTSWETASVSSEIITKVCTEQWENLKSAPVRICLPNFPVPTSPALTKDFYPGASDIVHAVSKVVSKPVDRKALQTLDSLPHDVPGKWFKGPF